MVKSEIDGLEFVRVSTGSQDESTQITTLDEYAGANGIHVAHRMILHGYSASHGTQEPALREAIEGIRQGRWSVVLVTDSSRLDRREDLDAQAEILVSVRQAGGDVISVTEPQFGKTDFAGRIVTLVAQHGNAEKSRKVKDQTWRGVQAIIANKAWYGPLPAFWKTRGDRYGKQAYCAGPEAVKAVYEAVRDGQSLASIGREYGVYPSPLRKLIHQRANMTGIFECHYTYGGHGYKWEHVSASGPAVSKELWHAANKAMDARSVALDNRGGRPVEKATSWISGLLDCPGCDGHLYVLRGKTLRCGGKGKDRRSCGVAGIPLGYVEDQIGLICGDPATVYRYSKIPGNQAELDEMNAELLRVKSTLATSDDDDVSALVARRKELRDAIAAFKLEPDRYDMSPTGETMADLWWGTGDRREILKALKKYIAFHVVAGDDSPPLYKGAVWLERIYETAERDTLIELTGDVCIEMPVERFRQNTL